MEWDWIWEMGGVIFVVRYRLFLGWIKWRGALLSVRMKRHHTYHQTV